MPVDSNAFFGPLTSAIDLVVSDTMQRAQRRNAAQIREQVRADKESQFRRSGNLQTALQMMRSGDLTPESSGAIGKSISSIISDPDFSFQPGQLEQRQPQMFTTGAPEEDIGFKSGTQIPLDKAGALMRRRGESKKTIKLDPKITKALGLQEGQEVPVTEADSYLNAYIRLKKEQRLAKTPPKGTKPKDIKAARIKELQSVVDDLDKQIGSTKGGSFLADNQLKATSTSLRNLLRSFQRTHKPEQFELDNWFKAGYINEKEYDELGE